MGPSTIIVQDPINPQQHIYGDDLEEKPLSRGRCIYVVGATRSFISLGHAMGGVCGEMQYEVF